MNEQLLADLHQTFLLIYGCCINMLLHVLQHAARLPSFLSLAADVLFKASSHSEMSHSHYKYAQNAHHYVVPIPAIATCMLHAANGHFSEHIN